MRTSPAAAAARREQFGAPCTVLIVDDSAVARAALSRIVEDAPSLALAGEAATAERAIEWLNLGRCDVVLLDLDMPGRGGLALLGALVAAARGARVIVVSGAAEQGARVTLEALASGAADAIAKPACGAIGRDFGQALVERIANLGAERRRTGASCPIGLRAPLTAPVDVLAIGASTGGIQALAALLRALPAAFDAPILVTQHLPPTFMPHLAAQLATGCGRGASVAVDGERLRPGHIFVAPGEAHMGITGRSGYARIALSEGSTATRCRPSVDPMFASLAPLGSGAVGVVLSGMGRDGFEGAEALADAGGTLLAQDEASSAVWGMPGAIARAGLATLVASPAALARHVATRGSR